MGRSLGYRKPSVRIDVGKFFQILDMQKITFKDAVASSGWSQTGVRYRLKRKSMDYKMVEDFCISLGVKPSEFADLEDLKQLRKKCGPYRLTDDQIV